MIKFLYQLIKRQAKRENLFSINVNVCRCCVFGQQLLINIQDLWWIHSANMQEISNKIHCEITEKNPSDIANGRKYALEFQLFDFKTPSLYCYAICWNGSPWNYFFFVSASVKCKTSEKSVGKVEPNTKLCFATSYLLVFFKSSRRHNKNPSV